MFLCKLLSDVFVGAKFEVKYKIENVGLRVGGYHQNQDNCNVCQKLLVMLPLGQSKV